METVGCGAMSYVKKKEFEDLYVFLTDTLFNDEDAIPCLFKLRDYIQTFIVDHGQDLEEMVDKYEKGVDHD